jgi:hypothetical protein
MTLAIDDFNRALREAHAAGECGGVEACPRCATERMASDMALSPLLRLLPPIAARPGVVTRAEYARANFPADDLGKPVDE